MICNGRALLDAAPIRDMLTTKERAHGVSHGLSEAGYDIRIKQDVRFSPFFEGGSGMRVSVDGGELVYGRFTIASSVEEFTMPHDLIGVVHDKSSHARRGLSVFNTILEPSWRGWLTLELVYHGREPLHIPAGSGIAQVIFHRIEEPAEYRGRYQDQADMPISAIEATEDTPL